MTLILLRRHLGIVKLKIDFPREIVEFSDSELFVDDCVPDEVELLVLLLVELVVPEDVELVVPDPVDEEVDEFVLLLVPEVVED